MLTLVIKQENSNWDIFANEEGRLFAVAKEGSGAETSHMGDKNHIVRLMSRGWFDLYRSTFTEAGLELFSGLTTRLIFNEDQTLNFGLCRF